MEKIYKANELLFSVQGSDEDFGNGTCIVALTPKDYWDEEGYVADFLGGHNVDNNALIEVGVNPDEIMEAIWEFEDETDVEKAHQKLLNYGFIFNSDFDRFVKHTM